MKNHRSPAAVRPLSGLIAGLRIAAMISLLTLAACDQGAATPQSTQTARLNVVTTTTQIASMTEAVAGDLANVQSLLPPGADPHTYEPRPSDIRAISSSALVLKNGVALDDWVDKIINNAGGNHLVVVVSRGVPVRKGDNEEPTGDPHIWFDVTNAMTMTRNIRDALVQVDPPDAAAYKANADAYLGKLEALDKYIFDQINALPPANRKLVTNHDAFGYYIARYGLTFVGSIIPSMSTDAQPSAQDVAGLIEKIKTQNVKAIFLENSINPQLAQQVSAETGIKIDSTLSGDSLGAPGTPTGTYESMMRYNTDTIVAGLK